MFQVSGFRFHHWQKTDDWWPSSVFCHLSSVVLTWLRPVGHTKGNS